MVIRNKVRRIRTLLVKSFYTSDEKLGINSHIPLELVGVENINKILRSSLVKPSIGYPIGLISGDANNSDLKIKVLGEINKLNVYSYMAPKTSPNWSYVTVAGKYDHLALINLIYLLELMEK